MRKVMIQLKGKKILFITTKNLDYIRNTQEINLLREHSSKVTIIGSNSKRYIRRIFHVYLKLAIMPMKSFDVIFVGFAPQFIIPFFGFKFKNIYLIIDFFISFYDTLVFDRKKFKDNSFISTLLKWLDTKTIKSADCVISDTKAHGAYFIDEFGLEEQRLKVLYLEADKEIYYPRKSIKPETFKEKFIVLYFGTILPLQGIDIILQAIDILRNEEDIHFILIGPISPIQKKEGKNTVEFIEWLSQEELAKYISYADLCLAGHFNKEINKAKRTIPGKAFIYELMNKRMLLGENAANKELYDENRCNVVFTKMGDANDLAEKILAEKERYFKGNNLC